MATKIKRSQSPQPVITYDLMQVAPDRREKDIGKLRSSIESAESILVPNRARLYDLYHDLVTIDGHLSGILKKRTDAITNKTLRYVGKDKQKVDTFDDLINSAKFGRIIELAMERKYWGLSGVEFLIGEKFDFAEIPRKHILIDRQEIAKSQYNYTGVSYGDKREVWVMGDKRDLGQLLQCSMYALYKRSGFGDFANYVEIFGQPVRLIYYDAYDTRTKEELRKVLEESGSSLAMMIPKQATFQMLDGKTSNSTGELQERLIICCNQEMSIAILGASETTSSSKSSGYAQAAEHGKQQLEITKSDLIYVQNTLNDPRFIDILRSYSYPVSEGGCFEFELELDLEALTKRLAIDEKINGIVPIDDDYWYFTYGIPKPKNYDALIQKREDERSAQLESMRAVAKKSASENKEETKIPTEKRKLFDTLRNFFGLAPDNGALGW